MQGVFLTLPRHPKVREIMAQHLYKASLLHTYGVQVVLLMDKFLHDPKDPKLWELWSIPYYGSCRILSINRSCLGFS